MRCAVERVCVRVKGEEKGIRGEYEEESESIFWVWGLRFKEAR